MSPSSLCQDTTVMFGYKCVLHGVAVLPYVKAKCSPFVKTVESAV